MLCDEKLFLLRVAYTLFIFLRFAISLLSFFLSAEVCLCLIVVDFGETASVRNFLLYAELDAVWRGAPPAGFPSV